MNNIIIITTDNMQYEKRRKFVSLRESNLNGHIGVQILKRERDQINNSCQSH